MARKKKAEVIKKIDNTWKTYINEMLFHTLKRLTNLKNIVIGERVTLSEEVTASLKKLGL
jgi:hypothetical protein